MEIMKIIARDFLYLFPRFMSEFEFGMLTGTIQDKENNT
jgi:hypothetical protein